MAIVCGKCGRVPVVTASGIVCCGVYKEMHGVSAAELRRLLPELVSESVLDRVVRKRRKVKRRVRGGSVE